MHEHHHKWTDNVRKAETCCEFPLEIHKKPPPVLPPGAFVPCREAEPNCKQQTWAGVLIAAVLWLVLPWGSSFE